MDRTADHWFLSGPVEVPDSVCRSPRKPSGGKIVAPKANAAAQNLLRRVSQHLSCQMEAAKVCAGLKLGQPVPEGMRIAWAQKLVKMQRCSAFGRMRCSN